MKGKYWSSILRSASAGVKTQVKNDSYLHARTSVIGPVNRRNSSAPNPIESHHVGIARTYSSNYSRIVVAPQVLGEDVGWLKSQLLGVESAVYIADNRSDPLHPPRNKGHEVMIYLTFIIDHYDALPDFVIFMHAHRRAWHNNDLLGFDAAEMIKKLNGDRVMREGYMSMRCQWNPGCPEWLHPKREGELLGKQEQTVLAKCWNELFPLDTIPQVLSQPCCAQFAVSKHRIHSIPLSRYVFYRDWLLRTPLTDYISGRVWEFTWHFMFTGFNTYCPSERECYCDGFGVCFGGEAQYSEFSELRRKKEALESELRKFREKEKVAKENAKEGALRQVSGLVLLEPGRDIFLLHQIEALRENIESQRLNAYERGKQPEN